MNAPGDTLPVTDLVAAVLALGLVLLLVWQVRRIWRVKSVLEHFVFDLRLLNKNLDRAIAVHRDGAPRPDAARAAARTCEHCESRLAYFDPAARDPFHYTCRWTGQAIALSDTCARFRNDVLRSRI